MELTQIIGNTWVAEGLELIPFYRLADGGCILLDSGLKEEREALEQALLQAQLHPIGILCSHAHVDHCANNGYLQKKYHIPVALTLPEAGMCSCILNLKCYCLVVTPQMAQDEMSELVHTPDVLIPPTDGPFTFAGVEFQIIHTPGHSSGHVALVTPDGVCYTADALLSHEYLGAKLPYGLSHKLAMESRDKLRSVPCKAYVMAHRGVCRPADFDALVQANHQLVAERVEEIYQLVTRPMTASEIARDACALYQLYTKKPRRSLRFERNIRFFTEYLVDEGRLVLECQKGVTYYRQEEGAQ